MNCSSCGWSGISTFYAGRPLAECPRCSLEPGELEDWREMVRWIYGTALYRRALRYFAAPCVFKLRAPRRRVPQPPREPRQPRNSPCACGSGRKFKKCCGA